MVVFIFCLNSGSWYWASTGYSTRQGLMFAYSFLEALIDDPHH